MGKVVDVVGGEVYVGSSKLELAAKFTPKVCRRFSGVLGSLTAPYSIQNQIQIQIQAQIQIQIETQTQMPIQIQIQMKIQVQKQEHK